MLNMSRSPSRNGAVTPDGNFYQVGSMLFETVEIPRVSPIPPAVNASRLQSGVLVNVHTVTRTESSVPVIRLSLATSRTSEDSSYYGSVLSLPSLIDEKPYAPWEKQLPPSSVMISDENSTIRRPPVHSTLCRNLFILGFLFPLLWLVGGLLLCRRSRTQSHKAQTQTQPSDQNDDDEIWAWACVSAFAISLLLVSIALLALHANGSI